MMYEDHEHSSKNQNKGSESKGKGKKKRGGKSSTTQKTAPKIDKEEEREIFVAHILTLSDFASKKGFFDALDIVSNKKLKKSNKGIVEERSSPRPIQRARVKEAVAPLEEKNMFEASLGSTGGFGLNNRSEFVRLIELPKRIGEDGREENEKRTIEILDRDFAFGNGNNISVESDDIFADCSSTSLLEEDLEFLRKEVGNQEEKEIEKLEEKETEKVTKQDELIEEQEKEDELENIVKEEDVAEKLKENLADNAESQQEMNEDESMDDDDQKGSMKHHGPWIFIANDEKEKDQFLSGNSDMEEEEEEGNTLMNIEIDKLEPVTNTENKLINREDTMEEEVQEPTQEPIEEEKPEEKVEEEETVDTRNKITDKFRDETLLKGWVVSRILDMVIEEKSRNNRGRGNSVSEAFEETNKKKKEDASKNKNGRKAVTISKGSSKDRKHGRVEERSGSGFRKDSHSKDKKGIKIGEKKTINAIKATLKKKVEDVTRESSLKPKYTQFGNKEKFNQSYEIGDLNKKKNENESQSGGTFWGMEGGKKKLKKEAGWLLPDFGNKEEDKTPTMIIETKENEQEDQMILKEDSENGDKNENKNLKKESENIDFMTDEGLRRSTREKREPRKNYDKALLGRDYDFSFVDFKLHKVQRLSVVVSLKALFMMNLHAHLSTFEVIGLLGGKVIGEDEITIEEALSCTNISESSNSHSVEMDPTAQVDAQEKLERWGYKNLGWYHSHPVFKTTPSQIDQETHLSHQICYKDHPYIGIIIGPYSTERGFSKTKGEVFIFHVLANCTYKLNYNIRPTLYLEKQDFVDIENIIKENKNFDKGVKMDQSWRKGVTYKDKIMSCLGTLLEENLDQFRLSKEPQVKEETKEQNPPSEMEIEKKEYPEEITKIEEINNTEEEQQPQVDRLIQEEEVTDFSKVDKADLSSLETIQQIMRYIESLLLREES